MSLFGRRARTKEIFRGPRLRVQVAPALKARSAFVLAVVSVLIGGVVAAALAAGVVYGVRALMHSVGTDS